MFKTLKEALDQLPELLKDSEQWHSSDIDHPPRIQRIWIPWEGNKILLHRTSPCGPDEALYRPHPWPSAMAVMRGQCEIGIGYGPGLELPPPVVCRLVANGGDCYEMTEEWAWHYIRPLQETFTIMVTGQPWDRGTPKPDKKLSELDKEDKEDLLFTFNYHLERWPIRIPNV